VDRKRTVVTDMDAEARKAAFAEAKARSLDALARTADVKVEPRDHGVEYWQRPEPAPAPVPQPNQPTVAEIEMLRSQDWARFVDGRLSAALAAHDELWRDVIGAVIAEERKKMRAEISAEVGQLRADVTVQKAHAGGDVVELPPFIERRRHG
jgi:hypothetical protein